MRRALGRGLDVAVSRQPSTCAASSRRHHHSPQRHTCIGNAELRSIWQAVPADPRPPSLPPAFPCPVRACVRAAGSPAGQREPLGWPPTLDVRMRVDLAYVIHSMYCAAPPAARALRLLLPAGGPDDRCAARARGGAGRIGVGWAGSLLLLAAIAAVVAAWAVQGRVGRKLGRDGGAATAATRSSSSRWHPRPLRPPEVATAWRLCVPHMSGTCTRQAA